jgi:hypothetical protein
MLEDQVRERTRELERALDLLNASNAALEDANRETERARQNLADAIETVQEGFALFGPDDVLVMCIDATEGKSRSNTLSIVLHRFLPIAWQRSRQNCYRILGLKSLTAGQNYWEAQKVAPELFKGLMFDLKTGLPLNAKPDMTDRVDKDARKVWVAALRRFKYGIKVRAKMGVFTPIAENIVANRHVNSFPVPRWDAPEWSDMLYESIRDTQFPTTLLQGIVLSSNIRWTAKIPGAADVIRWTDSLINTKSIELRTRFGVFTEDKP